MKADKADNIVHRDYVLMNNDLESPYFYLSYSLIESERMIITKYRSGSHHLNLLAGSRYNTPRDRRLCKCREIQSPSSRDI